MTYANDVEAALAGDFATLSDLVRMLAAAQPEAQVLSDDHAALSWGALDALVDRAAAALQRDGVAKGGTVAIAAPNRLIYVVAYLGALRAGAVPALLTISATADAVRAMLVDSGASHLFIAPALRAMSGWHDVAGIRHIALDGLNADDEFGGWLAVPGARPAPVAVAPRDPFNIIYSSGTTGAPKGIVQDHAMRFVHMRRAAVFGYDRSAVTLLSTPLYSNTTLVGLLPALAGGGRVILMEKFAARLFLAIAERERVTHAMLVPVQYQRLMAEPDFDRYDLSAFRLKTSTSAPFDAALKRDVLRRWPGRLIEIYGMTEGGGTCLLAASDFPDKLHTVGRPADGHDIRLIDEDGREVAPGEVGEIVGRSPAMMTGYHRLPDKTAETEWFDPEGRRFIRQGDLGRFDADGFLTLIGRRKDMIISGGFNIYPSDLEAELLREPQVVEAAVVGMPSPVWGETPVAFVVMEGARDPAEVMAAANARLGKTQRIAAIHRIAQMPRSAVGKILKRELRDIIAAGTVSGLQPPG